MAQFPLLTQAGQVVQKVVKQGLLLNRMELLDDYAMKSINIAHRVFPPYREQSTLLFEIVGPSNEFIREQIKALKAICTEASMFENETGAESQRLWNIRKAAFFATKALGKEGCKVMTTDVAVPISHLVEMLDVSRRDLNQHGIRI